MNSFKKKIMATVLAVSLVVGMAVPVMAEGRSAATAATGTITFGTPQKAVSEIVGTTPVWQTGEISMTTSTENITGETVIFKGATVTIKVAADTTAVVAQATSGTAAEATVAKGATATDVASAVVAGFDACKDFPNETALNNYTFSVESTTKLNIASSVKGVADNSVAITGTLTSANLTTPSTLGVAPVAAVDATKFTVASNIYTYVLPSSSTDNEFNTIDELVTQLTTDATVNGVSAVKNGTAIGLTATTAGAAGNNIALSVANAGTGGSAVVGFANGANATTAATPTITGQPTAATYTQNDSSVADLSVTANGTSLTYQWYSNASDSNSAGTIISGATSSTYTPPVSTVGITYYYCVVTNTEAGSNPESVAVASSTAKIEVTATPGVSAVPSFAATSVARTKKSGTNEATITFTLSSAKANATFKVYNALTGGSEKTGFTAVLQSGDTDIKLTHATDVPAGKYYISIDDDGSATAYTESARTEVTVTEWVADTTKVATYNQAVTDATALKTKYKVFDNATAQTAGKADMFPTEYSVIASDVTTLNTALTNAGSAFTAAIDDAAIVAATSTITTAMTTFENAKVAGTKAYTDAQALLDIAAEEARIVGITVNDADSPSKVNVGVRYVTTAQMSTYTTALGEAKALTGNNFNASTTPAKVTALEAAVDILLGQVETGTKPSTTPTPPPTYTPSYSGGGSSTPTSTPSTDLSTIISNSAVSANTPKGTEVEVPSSISDPTFDTREVAVNAPEAKAFVNTAANAGFAFAKVFQMNLFDGTTKVTKVSDGRVKIALPFAGKTGYEYIVLRYEANGGITAMPALYKDGQITFTTDHFSLYAIAVASSNKNLFTDTTVKPAGSTSVPQTAVCGLTKLF